MYKKSLVSLAVLSCLSAAAMAGDTVSFNDPTKPFVSDDLSIYGADINAADITITVTTPETNGITAYGTFNLTAANDISISGTANGIFTPTNHDNASISIKTDKNVTISGAWAVHSEGKGTISIEAGNLVLEGGNGHCRQLRRRRYRQGRAPFPSPVRKNTAFHRPTRAA